VITPSQRSLPDNTQLSQHPDIHAPGEIRTHNPSKRGATDHALGRAASRIGFSVTYCLYTTAFQLIQSPLARNVCIDTCGPQASPHELLDHPVCSVSQHCCILLHSAVLPTPQFRLSELLALAHDWRDSAHMFAQTSHFAYRCRYTPPPPPPPRSALDAKCDDLVPTPTARSSFFNFPPSSCFRYAVQAELPRIFRQTVMICEYEDYF
jgi:hypothetical protein